MDAIKVIVETLRLINSLRNIQNDILWNEDECQRLLDRIQGLSGPLERIQKKCEDDEKLPEDNKVELEKQLQNMLRTVKKSKKFVAQFQRKKTMTGRIYRFLMRKDIGADFESLHTELVQHVADLTLGMATRTDQNVEEAVVEIQKKAEKAANGTRSLQISGDKSPSKSKRRFFSRYGFRWPRWTIKSKDEKSKVEKKKGATTEKVKENKDWCCGCLRWCCGGNGTEKTTKGDPKAKGGKKKAAKTKNQC